MKQLLSLLLILALTGCAPIPRNTTAAEVFTPTPSDSDAVSLGLAVTAHLQKSMHATQDSHGRIHLELTVAAVLVDARGVIRQCAIDGVRAVVPFDQGGTPLLYTGTVFPSKITLGADYGMARASSLGQEWDEQASQLADACVGKTLADLQTGDVTASVTIAADDALAAVVEAVENAAACDARAGDSLRLVCRGVLESSSPAYEEYNGLVALRCAAATHVLRAGGSVVSRHSGLFAAVPLTALGRIACPTEVGLSPLSDVLYPAPVSDDEQAALQALLAEN